MRASAWGAALGAVAIAVACTLPAAATAKRGFVIPPSRSTEFRLKGSGGYSISVLGNHGRVSLTAKRGGSSVVYSARGLTSSRRIKARFGGLGRVSVGFHPTRPPHLVPEPGGNCKGGGEVVQAGRFVGTIAFEGEQGYTAVHASRAMGKVTKTFKQTCSGQESEGSGPAVTILSASSKSSGVFVTAFKLVSRAHPRFDGSVFGASIAEFRPGGLSILRSISATASLDAFTVSGSGGEITSATIAPPQPFTGTAEYQLAKGSSGSWMGSLVGDFPGRGEVSLAGPEFSAEISR
jgi:hypothetical protein